MKGRGSNAFLFFFLVYPVYKVLYGPTQHHQLISVRFHHCCYTYKDPKSQDISTVSGRARIWTQGFSSVQFSLSVMSDSLLPHESQHARSACPSPIPSVYSNSYPLSQWCHPTISAFVVPFSSCPQSLPVSGSFPMSQLFAWGGQSIGVSASA